jgi:hypothetical protein
VEEWHFGKKALQTGGRGRKMRGENWHQPRRVWVKGLTKKRGKNIDKNGEKYEMEKAANSAIANNSRSVNVVLKIFK